MAYVEAGGGERLRERTEAFVRDVADRDGGEFW
jgi:hypothetical protein